MSQLFETITDTPVEPPWAGQIVAVAVNANLWRAFDYLWPAGFGTPAVGQRVRVPFGRGNRTTLGFVVGVNRPRGTHALKPVAEVLDSQTLLDDTLWKLGAWISQYYLTPLGMTLAAMIPSAVGKRLPQQETVAFLTSEPPQWPKALGPKQRRLLDELLEARRQGIEPLTVEQMLHHGQATRDTLQRLAQRMLVRLEQRPVILSELAEGAGASDPALNEDQQRALDDLTPKLGGGFSVSLLYGVTGSGKTEVYVRAIRKVIEQGRQAIVLAPEIALATQTLGRLVQRLPRVAVLHSGLTDVQRAFYYDQIRQGHAAVVVGPRSAIFAPTPRLGLIVVDEEHEPSYKQDTAPRYHGRDTAVMRARLDAVPVILGSATPSMESMHNVQQGRYDLHRLPRRVRNLPMPRLAIVPLRKEMTPGKIELLGRTLTLKMAAALDRCEQIILLMNRRGYASHVFCPKCGWVHSCEQCSRALVFHQATQLGMCHYCQSTHALPGQCPACQGKIILFGWGIQRIEDELTRKFPQARVARMDSDTMTSPRQFREVFDKFSAGELDILLGTQMVAKGLDFPRVSLVGVVSADTSLAIPDFRADERTFQLIVQVAGRAGRADLPGEVIVQTLQERHPAIVLAATHDFDSFAQRELDARKDTGLPPFGRLVRFIARHEDVEKAEKGIHDLADQLRQALPAREVRMLGPQPAMVRKVRNQFRFQILLITPRPGMVQNALGARMEAICRDNPAEIIADVDPMHLM